MKTGGGRTDGPAASGPASRIGSYPADLFGHRYLAKVVSLYVVFSVFYIFVSDRILGALVHDEATILFISIAKGWLFILITTALLYLLISRFFRALRAQESEMLNQALRREEELRRILEHLPVAIGISKKSEITFLNRKFTEILGYGPGDIASMHDWAQKAYPDPDYRRAVFEKWDATVARSVLRKEVVPPVEFRVTRKDGDRRDVLISSVPMGDDVLITGFIDITEGKKAEQEIAAAREREKQTEEQMRLTLEKKLKTSLNAAAVAHEINQPLSRILLRAQLDAQGNGEGRDETLAAIVADAERVVSTIEKMKVLLRNVETTQHPVDLGQVVRSAIHQVKALLQQHNVTVRQDIPPADCTVQGDDVQLQLAVMNLLRNAAEAIGAVNSPVREISIACIARNGTIDMVVGDSGPGWPGGTIDEMLLATSKPGGTGIGLYIVKTAVENHRGKIVIGRSPLGGAEFRITLDREARNVRETAAESETAEGV